MDQFSIFYEELHTSALSYTEAQISQYLDELDFPTLTEDQRSFMDREITLEGLADAVRDMSRGKASGPDGLPLEVYTKYREEILPTLLEVLRSSHVRGFLPDSFSEATIIDKDSLECGSYRPISLLNVDYKLLTKILANRLNTFIANIIHQDQAGLFQGGALRIISAECRYCLSLA